MRLLQLATGPDEMLDLHPNLTVVTGLDADSHSALVAAVAGLARAEASGRSGLLEAHGVLFDLDPLLLRLIERDDAVDPIVQPGQLPTQPISVDARELRSREQAFAGLLEEIAAQAEKQSRARDVLAAAATAVDEARRARGDAERSATHRLDDINRLTRLIEQLTDQRRRAAAEIEGLRPALVSATAAKAEVERRTEKERDATEAAVALRSAIEGELAAIDDTLRQPTDAELERAAAALREVEAAVEAERAFDAERAMQAEMGAAVAEDAAQLEPAAVRLERLDARDRELEHLLVVVTQVERAEIEEAVVLLDGGAPEDGVPSPAALALADELDRISAMLGEAGEGVPDIPAASLADARARLDDARQGLLEAEQAVRSPELDRDDVRLLEDTHSELVEVSEKAGGRFGAARASHRIADLRTAEEAVLERLGFASYSDFMMGYSLFSVDPEKEAALEAARTELAAAEDDWRRLERDTDAALARAATLDRRRELLEQARDLLGGLLPDGRPQQALRALLVPAVSARDAAQRLRRSLDSVGVDLGDEDLDAEELVLIAEAWLAEADLVDGRRRAALDERAALQLERGAVLEELEAERLAAAEPTVEHEEPVESDADREAARLERLRAARHALASAEMRHEAVRVAAERRPALVADLETAREMERSAMDASSGADAEVKAALAAEAAVAARLRTLEEETARGEADESKAQAALEALTGPAPDPGALAAAVAAAEARHAEAQAAVEAEDRALAALDAQGRAAALEIERLQDIVAAHGTGTATPAEELEWYLLARLAAQRSVSVAGSVPLLLDNALRGLDTDEVGHLLGRLERMAEAVQVIVISEDPVVAGWAEAAGPARAAVVRPSAA